MAGQISIFKALLQRAFHGERRRGGERRRVKKGIAVEQETRRFAGGRGRVDISASSGLEGKGDGCSGAGANTQSVAGTKLRLKGESRNGGKR